MPREESSSFRRRATDLEAALFDFDGTLVDASDAICQTFNAVARDRGLGEVPEAAIRAMIGRPLREIFRTLLPPIGDAELEALVPAYRALFKPRAVALSRLLPGVEEAVEALAAAGIKLAVVTTRASDGAALILDGKGIGHRFETIIGLEHVLRPKPNPEPVLQALRALAAAPRRAVMIGDTPDDVLAGQRAGTSTVGVTTGAYDAAALRGTGADAVIAELGELLPLLGLRS